MKILSLFNIKNISSMMVTVALLLSSVIFVFNNKYYYTHQVSAQFPGTYDPKDKVFASLGLEPRSSPPSSTTISASNDAYYYSTLEYESRSEGWVPFPLALAAVSISYNATPILSSPSEETRLEISLYTLGSWMMGTLQDWNKTLTPPTSKHVPIGISQLKLVIAPDSKTTRAVLYRLYEHGVPGFESSAYTLPAAVLSNSNITFVSSDDDVIAALNSTTAEAVVGFVALTRGELFDSFFVSVSDDRGDIPLPPSSLSSADAERFKIIEDPTLTDSSLPNVSFRVDFNFSWRVIHGELESDPIYPLIGTVFSSQPVLSNCSDPNSSPRAIQAIVSILNYYSQEKYEIHNTQWSMLTLPVGMRSLLTAESLDAQTCVPAYPMKYGGSTVVTNLMNTYSMRYFQIAGQTSRYLPEGTSFGVSKIFSREWNIGATELTLSPAEKAANPEFVQMGYSAWAITFCFNLPGISRLVVSKCDILPIFNGSIDRWNDERLQRHNPSVKLPDKPIDIVFPSLFRSGATASMLRSIREIDMECNRELTGTAFSNVVVDTLWNLKVTRGYASGPPTLVDAANNPYSLVAAARPNAIGKLSEISLINVTDGIIVTPSAANVQRALESASFADEDTGAIDITGITKTPGGWGFLGMTYFVLQTSNEVPITNVRLSTAFIRAVKMTKWMLTDSEAIDIAIRAGYVPLPQKFLDNGLQKLVGATINNLYVFPELQVNVTAPAELNMPAIIGGGIGGFLFLVIVFSILSWYLGQRNKKSDKHAVKDGKTPMSLIFTDIQSSTTLWSVAPQAMAAALDLHNEILDRNIDKYNAYKIKTIGDAYMICCKDVVNAHNMCLDIQRDLYNAEWPSDEIDLAYADLFQADESPYQIYNPDGTEISHKQRKKIRGYDTELYLNRTNPSCYKGIAIRVGMTYGVAEPKLDEVTGAYDYHGPNVNLASRCESCGNGGQTIYSVHAIEALREAGVDLTDAHQISVTSLGKQPLKGIPAPIELYQILPAELAGRLFPRLRLDSDSAMTMELESETENTTNHSKTTGSAFTSTVGSNKNSDMGSKATNDSSNPSNASSAPTDDSNDDEYERSLPMEYRFTRYVSKQTRIDPRLLLFAYDVVRSTYAATPNEKTRRGMIDTLCKDWRVQDYRTKHHLFFKKELGYEEYWTIRLLSKVYGSAATRQRKRDPKNEHSINIMRRGMLKGDEYDGVSTTSTTDGTGTFPDAIKVSSASGHQHTSSGGSGTAGSNAPMLVLSQHGPSSVKYRSRSSTDGGSQHNVNRSASDNNAHGNQSSDGQSGGGVARINAYSAAGAPHPRPSSHNQNQHEVMPFVVPSGSSSNTNADVKIDSYKSDTGNV